VATTAAALRHAQTLQDHGPQVKSHLDSGRCWPGGWQRWTKSERVNSVPAMTGISAVCVAIARPYAPRIGGRVRHDARLSGTADLPFRTIAVLPGPPRHDGKSTANAVGWQHPPGFKSPILRCDQQFRPGAPSGGITGFRFPGPLRGHRRNPAARLPHLYPPPRGPCPARNPGRLAPITNRPAVMSARHGGPGTYPAHDRAGTVDTNLTSATSRSQETRCADSQPAACPGSPGRQRQTPTSSAAPPPRRRPDRHRQAHRQLPDRGTPGPPVPPDLLEQLHTRPRHPRPPRRQQRREDQIQGGATIRDDTSAHPSGEITTQAGPKFATTKANPGPIQVITLRPAGSATTSPS
jgi:hypothetical protein